MDQPSSVPIRTSAPFRRLLVLLGLLLLVFTIYAQCADHDFIFFDDGSYLYENPMVNRGLTTEGLRWSLTEAHSANWHPVTWWAHMLDVELFGLNPGGHILTNVALHALAAIVLLFAIKRLTGSLGVATFVAFVFAVHPANVENVAWVSEKKSTLSALFGFLALASYGSYAALGRRRAYWLALGWYALSLAAKPMMVTLPVLLLLLDWVRLRGCTPAASACRAGPRVRAARSADGTSVAAAPTPPAVENRSELPTRQLLDHASAAEKRRGLARWRPLLVGKLPFIALAAASCVITSVVQHQAGAMGDLGQANWGARCANAVFSYWRYLDLLFLPRNHAVLYPFLDHYPWPLVSFGLLGLVGISCLLLRYRSLVPWLAFGWAWYLITLLPVIGIIQVGSQSMADRYLYIPMVGLLVGLGMTVGQLAPPTAFKQLPSLVAAGWIAALALAAWAQASYWTSSETLFRQSLAHTKNNFLQNAALGLYLHKFGRFTEAEVEFRAGLASRPNNSGLLTNLAATLDQLGRRDEAIGYLEAAVNSSPRNPVFRYNLAVLYVRAGRLDEGIRECREAVRLNPHLGTAHQLLSRACELRGATKPATSIGNP